MSKSRYRTRTKPLKVVHPIVWALAGLAFLLLSVPCLGVTVVGGASSFRGMSTAGQVAKNLGGILLFLGVGAIWGYGGYGLIRAAREAHRKRAEFMAGNVTVEGRVVQRIEQKITSSDPYAGADRTEWVVLVQFPTDSGEMSLAAKVSKRLYRSLAPDQVIRVRYATADPTMALLEGESRW